MNKEFSVKNIIKCCGQVFLFRVFCSLILLLVYYIESSVDIGINDCVILAVMAVLVTLIVSIFINYETKKINVLAVIILSCVDSIFFMFLECFKLDDSWLLIIPLMNYVVVAFQECFSFFIVPFWLERLLTVIFVFISHFLIYQKSLIKWVVNAIQSKNNMDKLE